MGTKTRFEKEDLLLIRKMCVMCDKKFNIMLIFLSPVYYSLEHQAIYNVLAIQIQKSIKQTQ